MTDQCAESENMEGKEREKKKKKKKKKVKKEQTEENGLRKFAGDGSDRVRDSSGMGKRGGV